MIYIYFLLITLTFFTNSKSNDEKENKYIAIEFYSKNHFDTDKKYFYENITKNYLYSKIKLGSNEQVVEVKIDLNHYQTYILKNDFVNKEYIPFDSNSSNTFKTFKRFYTKNSEFSSGVLALDDLILYNNTQKIKFDNFYFAHIDHGFKTMPGSIGFCVFEREIYPQKSMNLIDQLKNRSIINNNNFAFIFDLNNNNNYKGKIYIGEHLSQIIPETLTEYERANIKLTHRNYSEEGISALDINCVYLGNYEYKINLINNNTLKKVEAQFDLKNDFIIATDEYSNMIYKIFFNNLFSSLKCSRESFVYYSNYYAVKCDKSINIKTFPDLIFDFSTDLEKINIILDYNDLFELKDDFFYFKIILSWNPDEGVNINQNWILGKEFLKLCLVNFNIDNKDITIYYKKKMKNEEKKIINEKWTLVILIVALIILGGIIILLVIKSKKLKNIIKKRNRLNILEVELTEKRENNSV